MAQRMVLRRFLAPVFSRKVPQCRWAPLPPDFLVQGSPSRPATVPTLARTFSTTKISNITFNVQDGPDFQDRVVNSETPVVVDFHARYPACPWSPQNPPLEHRKQRERDQPCLTEMLPFLPFLRWCGPCKILGPQLEKMVAKQEGKVLMAKVDIDDNTDLAIEYEVSAVPTVLAIKNGDVVDKFVGIKDEDQLEAFLKKLIGC